MTKTVLIEGLINGYLVTVKEYDGGTDERPTTMHKYKADNFLGVTAMLENALGEPGLDDISGGLERIEGHINRILG